MRRLIECIAKGYSMRGAERVCNVSHSAVALWMKRSKVRDNRYVVDAKYFHEHIEAARAAFQLAQIAQQQAAEREDMTNVDIHDLEGEAHAQELLQEAAELGVKLDATDPILRNPRAHLSVNAGLRPAVPLDRGGMGKDEPPDTMRMRIGEVRRYSYAERVHHGPLTVHVIKR